MLNGGWHRDKLVGAQGDDVFEVSSLRDLGRGRHSDVIKDFGRGDDLVGLSGIDADRNASGDQAFAFIGDEAFSGEAGELRLAGRRVQGDVDGDGRADFSLVMAHNPELTVGDFIL